jgi:hypothetical protein
LDCWQYTAEIILLSGQNLFYGKQEYDKVLITLGGYVWAGILGDIHKMHLVQLGFKVPTPHFVMEYHGMKEFMELMKIKFNVSCVIMYRFSSLFNAKAI